MTLRCVTVFGGTGYLGRWIVARLVEDGATVRVAARHPDRFAPPTGTGDSAGRIEAVRADVREPHSVAEAIAGSEAVVNAVGLYVERGAESFDAVHVEGAATVARACAEATVGALVHISGIGANTRSASPYVRARARGEEAVQAAFPGATLLRPGALFGPGDAFITLFARMAERSPAIPLFGNGRTKVQPVFVGDVAEAVRRAVMDPQHGGKVYELGGPRVYTYRALIRLILAQTGKRRVLLPIPFPVWKGLAALLRPLPAPPLTRDQIALVERDNKVSQCALTLADLGVTATELEAKLPMILEFAAMKPES
ncbi:MAG: complex I NDUFA9 subunit family protein [Methyloligellaceae bacterium]